MMVRAGVDLSDLVERVAPILKEIRERGDEAVCEFARKFDGAEMTPSTLQVPVSEMKEAVSRLSPELVEAMRVSIRNIEAFHLKQRVFHDWEMEISPGITAGEITLPLDSVGLYVPRGKGSFPSMMMMAGVPAKAAGVPRIVVCTPPDVQGKADPATLAAASLIGISEVYAVGGVQAIGALAYGVGHIPKVDKIVGPGSGYVMAAKRVLSAEIDTGMPAGPSEAVILADHTSDPEMCAVDLLIEAEHGPDSSAYLVTTSRELAARVVEILPGLMESLPQERRSYCATVLETNGGVVIARNMDDAVDFVNEFAPEHLQILAERPESLLKRIKCAGEVLLGPYTPGTLANYSIGPNAILPTSGFARTASALSVRDFTRTMSYSRVTKEGFHSLAPHTLTLAEYEGFAAHAGALRYRMQKETGE
jgi:histidinol dehydrogenase